MPDLSVLIPARNEMFLNNTIQNVLDNTEADTEIIVALDGSWPVDPVPDHEKVTLIYHPESRGQRASTNDAARIARGKYVMKLDAHCAVGPGFDRIMIEDMQPDWIMVPRMYNLHAFDWVCKDCGERRYQGRSGPCKKCGGDTQREIVWKEKNNPDTTAMRFDSNLQFKYWRAYKKRQKGDLVETMSILGACWMLTKERYFELDICDEGHGSWGQQGTEVACKGWLSGGKVICNKKTWFAHMFRTQGGDFGFPYPLKKNATNAARAYSREIWNLENPSEMPKWDKAKHSLQWLIDRFSPVPDWESSKVEPKEGTKGIVYYTDNRLDPEIMTVCQKQLEKSGLPIVSVSLKPIDFGENIVIDAERGNLTMFKQILAGLERINTEVVFFAEHDIMYSEDHFNFTPDSHDKFFYNQNIWKVDAETGRALFHYSNHTSQLCAFRDLLLEHYRKRVALVEANGFSRKMGYEPGTHRRKERVDDYWHGTWMSDTPNLDLRHKFNHTKTRWSKDQFRNKKYTRGWTVADEVPGWGKTLGRMNEILGE